MSFLSPKSVYRIFYIYGRDNNNGSTILWEKTWGEYHIPHKYLKAFTAIYLYGLKHISFFLHFNFTNLYKLITINVFIRFHLK